MADDPTDVARRNPQRSAPRIACFGSDMPQYFLFVENQVLFSVSQLSEAVMFWFILHYVLNLEYCNSIKSLGLFVQEFVYRLPATSYMKQQKSVGYLTITTDIQNYV